MEKLANYINGEYVAPISGKYFENFDPSTGKVTHEIPDSDAQDIDKAVAAAKAAFPAWSEMSVDDRGKILVRIGELLAERQEEFARAESSDQGKTYRLSFDIEMPRATKNFNFFATAMLHHKDETAEIPGMALNYSRREPIGVAGLISPWNLPLYLLTWKIAPALACGNTAVCKPSELTPVTAHMLGSVMTEAGLPPGVCNIVLGTGQKAGDALTKHPDVPLVSFTGGTETAHAIMKNCQPHFKKVSLELGGKNPGIIFDDADMEDCIPTTVRSSFQNQGEICLCNSRLFVQESIYDKFMEKFLSEARNAQAGDPFAESSFLGPLVSASHRDKVRSYIDLAKKEGATIHLGGGVPKLDDKFSEGYFLEPTIISDLSPDSRLLTEEIFGPVVTISKFTDEADAIAQANSVKYGLSASVWTTNIKRAHRVAHAIKSGTVWVNTWMLRDLRVPFGGMKHSGLGREGGEHSIDFYSELKNVCVKL